MAPKNRKSGKNKLGIRNYELGLFKLIKALLGLFKIRDRKGEWKKSGGKQRNPNTVQQQEIRNNLSVLSRMWKGLSYDKIYSWNNRSLVFKNYKHKRLYTSGYQLYMHVNMNLLKIGCKPIAELPDKLETPMKIILRDIVVVDTSVQKDILLGFEPELDANNYVVLYATEQTKAQVFPDSKFKKIGVLRKGWNEGVNEASIYDMYVERFGALKEEDMLLGFKLVVIESRTGQSGEAIYAVVE